MRSRRHLSSSVMEDPRGQYDKNKLPFFFSLVESNSLTPYTSYLESSLLFRLVLIVLIKYLRLKRVSF